MADTLLAGRRVLVTGADTPFGRDLALGLADAGAAIAAAGSSGGEQETAAAIVASGQRAEPVVLDFGERAAAERAFEAAAQHLGRLDTVVHASIDTAALDEQPLSEVDDAAWDRSCEAVIRSALFVAQAAHTALRERGGHLLFVAPTLALSGAAGRVPLATGAAGVRLMAISAARQWASLGITVNCIAPDVDQLSPRDVAAARSFGEPVLGRRGDVRLDVAPVVALLASDAAHFVTGETIKVDGGSWFAG